MPVCLYDGNVYSVESEFENMEHRRELMLRSEVLMFFLDGHKEDIIIVYDSKESEKGYITYYSLTRANGIVDAITRERLVVGTKMWDNAQDMLHEKAGKIVPVYDRNGEMVYFAKYAPELEQKWDKFVELRDHIDVIQWKKFRDYQRHIHIVGINDVLYELRRWLISVGAEVSVEAARGEWGLFEIKEDVSAAEEAIVVDENCEWIDTLYSEYLSWMQEDIAEMDKLYFGSYEKTEEKSKVIFWMPAYTYFLNNVKPLMMKYLHKGKTCIIAIPPAKKIAKIGLENLRNMIAVIKELETAGGIIFSREELESCSDKYAICYLCSEYSGLVPSMIRDNCDCVVALQTTAIYTHMCGIDGRFEQVFSGEAKRKIDFLIASEYIASWVCDRDKEWSDKVLRLGYPTLDALYYAYHSETVVPEEWKEKIQEGQKVLLFMDMPPSRLEWLAEDDSSIVIWRPHPLIYELNKERLAQLSEQHPNLIIDHMISYYAAFKVSDALIADYISSILVNYLYTGKPVCIYDHNMEEVYALDFRQEAWYKSAYIATEEKEVMKFVEMIKNGKDVRKQELEKYRSQVVSHFDGKVCDRIYDFMERQ